jgi:Ca-activated chloride channel family protein
VELLEGEGVDVVLVLDVSLSMLAEDFPPNRLAALRTLARDFITRSGGNRVGIVAFARDAVVQSPLTRDHAVLLQLLDGATVYLLDPGLSGGTAVGDALLVAAERLRGSRLEGRDQAVVLITDGESNEGLDPVLAARYLAADGVRLYAIGVGGTEPVEVSFEGERVGSDDQPYLAALDDRQLRAVTEAAGGRFFRATDVDALEQIFAELSRLESAPLVARPLELRRSWVAAVALGVLSLFAAHLSLSLAVRRPYR